MNYYNEHDPNAAQWLRELIKAGEIPNGDVDERDIQIVSPTDLRGYTQCHFFAGIGGWSLALRLAGWPDDQPVWTGSCPCQPFSVAGKGEGESDERHLWPVFRELIRACRPPTIFGEQVASAPVVGSASGKAKRGAGSELEQVWLDGVCADFEAAHYACGAADIPAAGVGAPHIRQRLFWVAHGARNGWHGRQDSTKPARWALTEDSSPTLGVGDTDEPGPQERRDCERGTTDLQRTATERAGSTGCGLEHTVLPKGARLGQQREQLPGQTAWSAFDLIPCLDGKARRIEPGTFPLAHGVSGRVGLLRGYGNAIVPQVAAEFIQAAREAMK